MIDVGSISGHFEIKVYDANTGKLTKRRSFPNLITNQGLIGMCSTQGADAKWIYCRVCVGNGTAVPNVDDTTLSNYLAASSTQFDYWGAGYTAPVAPDWVSSVSATARFNAGMFDGTTITEIGITNGESSHPVFSRALILDDYGNPTSLTILSNEYFDVTYTLKYHPKLTDTEFQFSMNGVTYDCVARAAHVNNMAINQYQPLRKFGFCMVSVYNTQTLGDITGEPIYQSGGIATGAQNYSFVPYESSEPYTYKCTNAFGLSVGNFDGGIGAALIKNIGIENNKGIAPQTQVSFNPKLPKDANTEMTFTLSRTVSRWSA